MGEALGVALLGRPAGGSGPGGAWRSPLSPLSRPHFRAAGRLRTATAQKRRKETLVLLAAAFERATALRLGPRPYCQMSGSLPMAPEAPACRPPKAAGRLAVWESNSKPLSLR